MLVVPVGDNSLFDSHFQVVSRLRDIPFYELNRPVVNNSATTSFRHLDWNKGNLLFDYIRYDRVLFGPGDLDDFQVDYQVFVKCNMFKYDLFIYFPYNIIVELKESLYVHGSYKLPRVRRFS